MRISHQRFSRLAMSATIGLSLVGRGAAQGEDVPAAKAPAPSTQPAPTTRPVTPKVLSDHVRNGLDWLAKHQQQDGGWSQGERSLGEYRPGEVGDKSDVADTCMAALAFMRAGSTPAAGEYERQVAGALDFVCGQVERCPAEGLDITDIRTTRIQTKLGQHIDTFAAALFLAELKDVTPEPAMHKRVVAALDKVMDKVQKNQKADGRWVEAQDGWASALCQSLATKAVNVAVERGANVDPAVVQRAQQFAANQFDAKTAVVNGSGSANVELYARAGNLAAFQNSANTYSTDAPQLAKRSEQAHKEMRQAQQTLQRATTQPSAVKSEEVAAAKATIARDTQDLKDIDGQLGQINANAENLSRAQAAVVDRMNDQRFRAGFGTNGGEEFLSYMNIGESLVLNGGDEFAKWDKGMTDNLNAVQNDDGSWSGQHCITGRTFCTSAALLVLMVDRSAEQTVTRLQNAN